MSKELLARLGIEPHMEFDTVSALELYWTENTVEKMWKCSICMRLIKIDVVGSKATLYFIDNMSSEHFESAFFGLQTEVGLKLAFRVHIDDVACEHLFTRVSGLFTVGCTYHVSHLYPMFTFWGQDKSAGKLNVEHLKYVKHVKHEKKPSTKCVCVEKKK